MKQSGLSRGELEALARLGAQARMESLKLEVASILQAFPDIAGGGDGNGAPAVKTQAAERRRAPMSAAGRSAVSRRMKAYWAAKRAEKEKAARKRP